MDASRGFVTIFEEGGTGGGMAAVIKEEELVERHFIKTSRGVAVQNNREGLFGGYERENLVVIVIFVIIARDRLDFAFDGALGGIEKTDKNRENDDHAGEGDNG